MASSSSSPSLSFLCSCQMIQNPYQRFRSTTIGKIKPSSIFSSAENHSSFICCFSAKKKLSFFDQILDYIEGGPKLRKWYGAPDLFTEDGIPLEEDESAGDEVRDAVLVTDGDSEIGQMIVLSLIVKRARVKALVKNKRAAMEAFGTYVESFPDLICYYFLKPIAGDTKDKTFLKKALKGVRAVICPNVGFLSNIESWKGLEHVILLSQLPAYRDSGGIQSLMNNNARKLAEEDESMVKTSGISYTIIRTGFVKNDRGGKPGFSFEQGSATRGSLSKEDAAFICVQALDVVPQKGLIFEVVNGDEKVLDWKELFENLLQSSEQ